MHSKKRVGFVIVLVVLALVGGAIFLSNIQSPNTNNQTSLVAVISAQDKAVLADIERQLGMAVKSGGINPSDYKSLDAKLKKLEKKKINTKKARALLAKLSVGGQRKEATPQAPQTPRVSQPAASAPAKPVVFTAPLFDVSKVSHITPLGELLGGYEEAQALAGVMINLSREQIASGKEMEIYAPTDMTLENYAYFISPNDGQTGWALTFRISATVQMRIDHITSITDKLRAVMISEPRRDSRDIAPSAKLSFKAGELIAYTSGTPLAHNWNIYMTDAVTQNGFVNASRYEGTRLRTARCPFDFYSEEARAPFLAKMGYNRAGESTTCGNVSHDESGTISGMWHFSEDPKSSIWEKEDGRYRSPLSVILNSGGTITIDQVENRELKVSPGSPTHKDPKSVTGEHCYETDGGFAFFKVVSRTSMQFSFGSGSCPPAFPAEYKTYHR